MPTQVKTIPLSGLSTSPSDYSVPDGHLASALGVVHEDDSIKNAVSSSPKIIVDFSSLLVHGMGSSYKDTWDEPIENGMAIYKHHDRLICYGEYSHNGTRHNIVFYIKDEETQSGSIAYDITNPYNKIDVNLDGSYSFTSIGNTLVYNSTEGAKYFLFENVSYRNIGSKIPELEMTFGLTGHIAANRLSVGSEEISIDEYKKAENPLKMDFFAYSDGEIPFKEPLIEGAESLANSFVDDAHHKGYFTQPFFVRYAYRLYDGSTTMASAPILMTPASNNNPKIHVTNVNNNRYSDNRQCVSAIAKGIVCKLRYIMKDINLSDWKDIVAGVNVYVSSPIYTYKQVSGIFKGANLFPTDSDDGSFYRTFPVASKHVFQAENNDGDRLLNNPEALHYIASKHDNPYTALGSKLVEKKYSDHSGWNDQNDVEIVKSAFAYNGAENYFESENWWQSDALGISLDYKTEKEIKDEIQECSNFYLLREYNIDELQSSDYGVEIDIPDGFLNTIDAKETIKEDYESHHDISSYSSTEYNGRLNLYNIAKRFFAGFSPFCLFQSNHAYDEEIQKTGMLAVVYISVNGRQSSYCRYVQDDQFNKRMLRDYVYYPDVNATKLFLYYKDNVTEGDSVVERIVKREYVLSQHVGLNGSFCFDGFGSSGKVTITSFDSFEEVIARENNPSNSEFYASEIRTSEVNNPFVFRAENVEQVGNGSIISLVPSSIALSEGQFGEFPMYAFTTEGVWALSVSSTGGFKAKQPFSRDVVTRNSKGDPNILQLDHEIMFATDRGLMLLAGSKVDCISEVFDGIHDDTLYALLNDHAEIRSLSGYDVTTIDKLNTPFMELIKDANFHYDYTHQRIIIASNDTSNPLCFIYNKKDRLWTQSIMNITSSVNSYPNAYAMAVESGKNVLVDLTQTSSDNSNSLSIPSKGIILTRPISLGLPNDLKTISNVLLRGRLKRDSASVILLASRDLFNWHVISSSRSSHIHHMHGTAFRYFRLAIISNLSENESLSSVDVEYEVKQFNKLR